jgi:hypothetical protein
MELILLASLLHRLALKNLVLQFEILMEKQQLGLLSLDITIPQFKSRESILIAVPDWEVLKSPFKELVLNLARKFESTI